MIDYEKTQQQKERAAELAWIARKIEVVKNISAALTALGATFTLDGGRCDFGDGVTISVAVTRDRASYSSKPTGRIRVKLDGYSGPQFLESKASAKKINSTRPSDFDYPAIAEMLVRLRDGRLSSRSHSDKRADGQKRGHAAMLRLGVKARTEHSEIWDRSFKEVSPDVAVQYTVYSSDDTGEYPLLFDVKLSGASEAEAVEVLAFLKAVVARRTVQS